MDHLFRGMGNMHIISYYVYEKTHTCPTFWGLGTAPCSQAQTLPAPTRKIRPGSPDSKAQTFTSEFRTFESTQLDSLALQKLRLGFSDIRNGQVRFQGLYLWSCCISGNLYQQFRSWSCEDHRRYTWYSETWRLYYQKGFFFIFLQQTDR